MDESIDENLDKLREITAAEKKAMGCRLLPLVERVIEELAAWEAVHPADHRVTQSLVRSRQVKSMLKRIATGHNPELAAVLERLRAAGADGDA